MNFQPKAVYIMVVSAADRSRHGVCGRERLAQRIWIGRRQGGAGIDAARRGEASILGIALDMGSCGFVLSSVEVK
jgi:hypothetical protein